MIEEAIPAEVTVSVSAGTDRRSRSAKAGCTVPAYKVVDGLIEGVVHDMTGWLYDLEKQETKRRRTVLGRIIDNKARRRTVTVSITLDVEARVEVFDTIIETDAAVHSVAVSTLAGVANDARMWLNDEWVDARRRAREAGLPFTEFRPLDLPDITEAELAGLTGPIPYIAPDEVVEAAQREDARRYTGPATFMPYDLGAPVFLGYDYLPGTVVGIGGVATHRDTVRYDVRLNDGTVHLNCPGADVFPVADNQTSRAWLTSFGADGAPAADNPVPCTDPDCDGSDPAGQRRPSPRPRVAAEN